MDFIWLQVGFHRLQAVNDDGESAGLRNIESGGVTTGKPKGRWSDDDDDGGDVRGDEDDDMDDKFEFKLNTKL